MVEFTDAATNRDARGSVGRTGLAPPDPEFEENKYRFRDYYNIIFQDDNEPVTHPDAALDVSYSSWSKGWYQHGSFARYIHDNSITKKRGSHVFHL
jgi:hypothetical protein